MTAADLLRHVCAPLVGVGLLAACATEPVVTPRLPEGRIAVTFARFPPQANFNVFAAGKGPAAGELGAKGAAGGAAVGAIAPVAIAGPYGIVLYPFMAPFTILAGAMVGGAAGIGSGLEHGLSTEDAEKVSALIDMAVSQLGVHEQVARRVVEKARKGGYAVELLPQLGPKSVGDVSSYAELRTTYAGVLELTMQQVGMEVRKGEPARVALVMKLSARTVCFVNMCVAGIKAFDWNGRPRAVSIWAERGANFLGTDFDGGYDTLAQYVWEILFPERNS